MSKELLGGQEKRQAGEVKRVRSKHNKEKRNE